SRRLDLLLSAAKDLSRAAVLFLDLDHFRVINDSLGHEAGDELLRNVATLLTGMLGKDDLVARFGGDGFVLLLAEAGTDGATRLADDILRALESPHLVGGRPIYTSASIGIVDDLSLYRSADGVLRDADAAMHEAKAAGRGTHRIVDHATRAQARKRLDIETGLREAIERSQLDVHYQPQFSLRSGDLVGFEALVRWQHPELGLV